MEPAWSGSISDSLGIRVVHNPADGLWAPGDEWSFAEALTIGSDTLGAAYQFGEVTSVAVAPDGTILVFDRMASEVRTFDAEGRHLRSIGREGAGPGEFSSSASGMFLMADGRLAVPDMRNTRITWLDLEGSFVSSTPTSYASGFPVLWDSDGSGRLVVQRRAMGQNQDTTLAQGDPLVQLDDSGGETELVVLPKARTVRMEGNAPRFTYFETEPSWDLGPSGTLRTGMTQEYRIEVRGADGTIRSILTLPREGRPVTQADRARYAELMRDALTRMGVAPDGVQRQIDRMEFGSTFPAFNQLMEGPDGTTLVQQVRDLDQIEQLDLSEERSRRLGSSEWDVFAEDGRYLGAVSLPERFKPLVWAQDAVFGRWLDDLDRAHVRKLAIRRPAS